MHGHAENKTENSQETAQTITTYGVEKLSSKSTKQFPKSQFSELLSRYQVIELFSELEIHQTLARVHSLSFLQH